MMDNSLYVPATTGRRFAAALVNLMCIGVVTVATESIGAKVLAASLVVVMILVFCLFPESPGKRLCNLRILDEDKRPIDAAQRFLRAAPCLVFFAFTWLGGMAASVGPVGTKISAVLSLLAVCFIGVNALVVLFSPNGRSLLDTRFRTRVYTPTPLPNQLKPRLWGIKIR